MLYRGITLYHAECSISAQMSVKTCSTRDKIVGDVVGKQSAEHSEVHKIILQRKKKTLQRA